MNTSKREIPPSFVTIAYVNGIAGGIYAVSVLRSMLVSDSKSLNKSLRDFLLDHYIRHSHLRYVVRSMVGDNCDNPTLEDVIDRSAAAFGTGGRVIHIDVALEDFALYTMPGELSLGFANKYVASH